MLFWVGAGAAAPPGTLKSLEDYVEEEEQRNEQGEEERSERQPESEGDDWEWGEEGRYDYYAMPLLLRSVFHNS